MGKVSQTQPIQNLEYFNPTDNSSQNSSSPQSNNPLINPISSENPIDLSSAFTPPAFLTRKFNLDYIPPNNNDYGYKSEADDEDKCMKNHKD